MANEISWRHSGTGKTLYATIRSTAGEMWNTAGTVFEGLTVANWADYDIALTETPASSYFYVGTFPAVAGNMVVGWYWVDIFEQAGAGPAIGDTLAGTLLLYWNGTTAKPWAGDTVEATAALFREAYVSLGIRINFAGGATATFYAAAIIGTHLQFADPTAAYTLEFVDPRWVLTKVSNSHTWLLETPSPLGTYTAQDGDANATATAAGVAAGTLTSAYDAAKTAATQTSVNAIATILSGITSLAKWLRGLFRKDTMDATAKSEVNDGGGAFDETTDSLEANRDNIGAAGAGLTAVGLSAAAQQDVANAVYGRRVWYVDASIGASGAGTSWDAAFKTVAEAVAAAATGDLILVGPGTYAAETFDASALVLEIRGAGQNATIITNADGSITFGACILSDLTLTDTSSNLAIVVSNGTESVRLNRVRYNSTTSHSLYLVLSQGSAGGVCSLYCTDCDLTNGVWLEDSDQVYIERSYLGLGIGVTTGEYGCVHGSCHGQFVIKDSLLYGMEASNDYDLVKLQGYGEIVNCDLWAAGGSGTISALALGDVSDAVYTNVNVRGCRVSTPDSKKDFVLLGTKATVTADSATSYDTTKVTGTVTLVAERTGTKIATINTNADTAATQAAAAAADAADAKQQATLAAAVNPLISTGKFTATALENAPAAEITDEQAALIGAAVPLVPINATLTISSTGSAPDYPVGTVTCKSLRNGKPVYSYGDGAWLFWLTADEAGGVGTAPCWFAALVHPDDPTFDPEAAWYQMVANESPVGGAGAGAFLYLGEEKDSLTVAGNYPPRGLLLESAVAAEAAETSSASNKAKVDAYLDAAVSTRATSADVSDQLGSGTRAVTITVTDGADPIETVRVRVTQGAETYVGNTNSSGQITFQLNDATWTVGAAKVGYTLASQSLKVNADTAPPTYAMTQVTPTVSDPGYVTGYLYCYDEEGAVEEGVTIELCLYAESSDGQSHGSGLRSATSDDEGYVEFVNLIPGASYMIRRGTRRVWDAKSNDYYELKGNEHKVWKRFEIDDDATDPYQLPSVVGEES